MENFIKEVEVDGISHSITLGDNMVGPGLKKDENGVVSLDINEEKLVKITYSELKSLRDNSQLIPGSFYRITDYVTTTTQSETKSANHPFDVIVLALSENTLCEDAKAILHEGDTYFANSDLSAWELKYCLDNDKTRFAWADETNGKGVIYYIKDEFNNECPYDFKNIMFKYDDKYYYTFSFISDNDYVEDLTLRQDLTNDEGLRYGTYCNIIKPYYPESKILTQSLNNNIFIFNGPKYEYYYGCYNNIFNVNCYNNIIYCSYFVSNTFGSYCQSNIFEDTCEFNTFGDRCSSNFFGYGCGHNTFGHYFEHNTFGEYCSDNTFKNHCYSNTFGEYCCNNTFGHYFEHNTFGEYCNSNTFGDNCNSNTFGDNCNSNTFGDSCTSNTFGDSCQNRTVNSDKTSITLNEEFYDDGKNALVPTKHPDLSTQPNILPYKFMGQYVYEQLVPVNEDLIKESTYKINWHNCGVDKPLILEGCEIIYGLLKTPDQEKYPTSKVYTVNHISYEGFEYDGVLSNVATIISVDQNTAWLEGMIINRAYLKIVYTSMPEEGDYYGYNNY